LLINFHVYSLKDRIKRIVNDYHEHEDPHLHQQRS
jgi:hypothetical protein